MKLILAIIQERDAEPLIRVLLDRGFFVTRIDSAGGFLRETNVTILIGVQSEFAPEVLRLIQFYTRARTRYVNPLMPVAHPAEFHIDSPVEVSIGGATIFVLPVERYERVA